MNTVFLVAFLVVCLLMLATPITQFLFNREIGKERRYLDAIEKQEREGK